MGVFTEDIQRLCGNIVALRKGRQTLRAALATENRDRRSEIAEMRATAGRLQTEMAHQSSAARNSFLRELKREVHGECRAVREDLAGARHAWLGKRG